MHRKSVLVYTVMAALLCNLLSVSTAAAETGGAFTDTKTSPYAHQIAYLQALGIARGDGEIGTYRPNEYLTRQEFAVILARLTDTEAAADFLSSIPTRYLDDEDIADWAHGAVNLADSHRWVQGYDDEKFHPTDNLTFAQAVTILVRALGHEPHVLGVYPNAYLVKGINLGLAQFPLPPANLPITREELALLAYNALFIPQLRPSDDGGFELAEAFFAGRTVVGVVEAVGDLSITIAARDPAALKTMQTTRPLAKTVALIGVEEPHQLLDRKVRITTADIFEADAAATVIEILTMDVPVHPWIYSQALVINNEQTEWKDLHYLVGAGRARYEPYTTMYSLNGGPALFPGTRPVLAADEALALDHFAVRDDWLTLHYRRGVVYHADITRFDLHECTIVGAILQSGTTLTLSCQGDGEAEPVRYNLDGASILINLQPAKITDLHLDAVLDVAIARVMTSDGTLTNARDAAGNLKVHMASTTRIVDSENP